MGIKFMGEVPFKDVYIHALVRDIKGQKMRKSKGNVIDPAPILEKYGADRFRFWCAQESSLGEDFRISEERISNAGKFITKLLNIARYIKEIHKVNERLKDLMADIISDMKNQIRFLAPVIAGIVVGITSMITFILGRLGKNISPPDHN